MDTGRPTVTRRVVVDASIVLSWLYEDEDEPLADQVLVNLPAEGTWVPQMWHFEVRNALLMAERRGRFSREDCDAYLHVLESILVRTDTDAELNVVMALARAHGLTFYDALYLELARRRTAELATLDGSLRRSARAEGI